MRRGTVVRMPDQPPKDHHHPADRLLEAVERLAAPVCVGIDPVAESLPAELGGAAAPLEAIFRFSAAIIEAVSGIVPCVKFQSACFERYRGPGMDALFRLLGLAASADLITILDGKRGDIGISAQHYAAAAFHGPPAADWLTVNSYLGPDGIAPFLDGDHGAFALVRTSNDGGDCVQALELADGSTVAEAVGKFVAALGRDHVGQRGYSALGAVVGATRPETAECLRSLMPQQIFLVPGFGAQGGRLRDVLPCFAERGLGAIVTASRSVTYAFRPGESDWSTSIGTAARGLAESVGQAVGLR